MDSGLLSRRRLRLLRAQELIQTLTNSLSALGQERRVCLQLEQGGLEGDTLRGERVIAGPLHPLRQVRTWRLIADLPVVRPLTKARLEMSSASRAVKVGRSTFFGKMW